MCVGEIACVDNEADLPVVGLQSMRRSDAVNTTLDLRAASVRASLAAVRTGQIQCDQFPVHRTVC